LIFTDGQLRHHHRHDINPSIQIYECMDYTGYTSKRSPRIYAEALYASAICRMILFGMNPCLSLFSQPLALTAISTATLPRSGERMIMLGATAPMTPVKGGR
jgi:hypothetical protein